MKWWRVQQQERVANNAHFSGRVGEGNRGDKYVCGKYGVKAWNADSQMVVCFTKRMDMTVVNTYSEKRGAQGVLQKWRKTHIGVYSEGVDGEMKRRL